MKRICSVFLIILLSMLLNGCSDSNNQTEAASGAGDEAATSDSTTKAKSDTQFSNQATYSYYNVGHNSRMAWRINKKGTAFGKTIKAVFSNGYTVIIPNTSSRYAKSDGFIFRPGIGSVKSGTGTSHGGVYMYAPYHNKSKSVTFYY